jgi:hypothetical protein
LQADAYSGYDHLYIDPERQIIEVACWAHYPGSVIIPRTVASTAQRRDQPTEHSR